jgi:hypothetical protein
MSRVRIPAPPSFISPRYFLKSLGLNSGDLRHRLFAALKSAGPNE